MKRLRKMYRSIPLGVRRPDSDELLGCPFSCGRRSERYGATGCEMREHSEITLANYEKTTYEKGKLTGWF